MREGKTHVQARSIRAATKLIEGHQIILPGVKDKTFSHNLFYQFSKTLDQLNGAVGTWKGVVLLVGFRNSNDKGVFPPRMVDSKFDRCADNHAKLVRTGGEGPLKDLII